MQDLLPSYFPTLALALLLTIAFSFLPERWVKPKTPNVSFSNGLLQALLVSILFLAVTLIVQRPIFSALAVSIFLIILSGVSNAKYKALREPLVFSDIAMFSQAFKHPRLYFPFLGLLPVIAAPIIIIALIITVLSLEPAMAFTAQRILISILAIVLFVFSARNLALRFTLTQEPDQDIERLGLLNSIFVYAIQARTPAHQKSIQSTLAESPFKSPIGNIDKLDNEKSPPHFEGIFSNITVIQSESFFDARRLHDSIKPDVLKNFDSCNQQSTQFGKLKVPAWGANTMRTEFAFLSGLKYQDLGLYRYYPYQYLHKMPISSIASYLSAQGYRCVCIHPHPESFFGRDRIFPQMGFDEFIDIKDFDTNNTFGPYISDQSVTNKILEITQNHESNKPDQPLFIFAITMENHGPLHLEKTTAEEQHSYFDYKPLTAANDLTVYLRHLQNADKMIADLTNAYSKFENPHALCFYGDHIPSMPNIYQQLDYDEEESDYFIWQNSKTRSSDSINTHKDQMISADTLAKTLLTLTGNLTGN
ncbi:LTA synthase family protein [uncultured Cocleimonas sp.]|uniref:LTA synthase family protein n=1 Tax=uncultured Cocleimonas sp. TaxID=1051587 RepID=UPI0026307DB6|nr:LTA synthase family protein [uncultured Cocleimonas sp.]